MLQSDSIVAFVGTTDPGRAKRFYGTTLGLPLQSEDGFALVFDAGGTMLRVAVVRELQPAGYTILGWNVLDIRQTARGLVQRGVAFERYPGMLEQDDLGIWAAPGGALVAWFKDPDGNTLSITQHPLSLPKRAARKPERRAAGRSHGRTPARARAPKRARTRARKPTRRSR